ncbi:MAG: gamma carbonic anhydrase family protein [Antricoccus sp.]
MTEHIYAIETGTPQIDPTAFIAPTACVVGDVTMGPNSSLWYGCVARADTSPITIGEDSNIQDCSTMHADPHFPLIVGNRVTVGHNVILHGATIHDDVLVGMGSIVMNGADVGSWSIIAAGAVITQGTVVPEGSLVAGVPAKVLRKVTDEDRDQIARNATAYTTRLDLHRGAKKV